MEIIKEGKKKVSNTNITCKNCDAVLKITRNDLSECPFFEVGKPTLYELKCPCCEKKMQLTAWELAAIL